MLKKYLHLAFVWCGMMTTASSIWGVDSTQKQDQNKEMELIESRMRFRETAIQGYMDVVLNSEFGNWKKQSFTRNLKVLFKFEKALRFQDPSLHSRYVANNEYNTTNENEHNESFDLNEINDTQEGFLCAQLKCVNWLRFNIDQESFSPEQLKSIRNAEWAIYKNLFDVTGVDSGTEDQSATEADIHALAHIIFLWKFKGGGWVRADVPIGWRFVDSSDPVDPIKEQHDLCPFASTDFDYAASRMMDVIQRMTNKDKLDQEHLHNDIAKGVIDQLRTKMSQVIDSYAQTVKEPSYNLRHDVINRINVFLEALESRLCSNKRQRIQ